LQTYQAQLNNYQPQSQTEALQLAQVKQNVQNQLQITQLRLQRLAGQ
jgi:hypothetical protein